MYLHCTKHIKDKTISSYAIGDVIIKEDRKLQLNVVKELF